MFYGNKINNGAVYIHKYDIKIQKDNRSLKWTEEKENHVSK